MTVQSHYIALWNACTDEDIARYRTFYADAWEQACQIAAGTRFTARRVAYAIAALSPQTQWFRNLDMAHELVRFCHESFEDDRPTREQVPVGGLSRSIEQALDALYDGLPPPGPKVGAFALNIEGDLTHVTIDRHMLDAGRVTIKDRDACEMEVRYLAGRHGLWPAEVQAVLWGKWRQLKGLEDVVMSR